MVQYKGNPKYVNISHSRMGDKYAHVINEAMECYYIDKLNLKMNQLTDVGLKNSLKNQSNLPDELNLSYNNLTL